MVQPLRSAWACDLLYERHLDDVPPICLLDCQVEPHRGRAIAVLKDLFRCPKPI